MNKLKKRIGISIIFLVLVASAIGQTIKEDDRGILYFGFGSHLSYYSPSDIRFISNKGEFDFTLKNVRAKDDRGIKLKGDAAQYSYQVGYFFKKKGFGVEFNFDHIKYFVLQNRVVQLKGNIFNQQYDKDTLLTPAFVYLEHSDGGNYALLNIVKWKNLYTSLNKRYVLDMVLKAGAGPVIPKTNSTLFGTRHRDDKYHISGYVAALEGGVRYNFLKNLYIIPSIKGSYANYNHFLIADGYGKQQWVAVHFNLLIGGQLTL
jgi:hypothetical protein